MYPYQSSQGKKKKKRAQSNGLVWEDDLVTGVVEIGDPPVLDFPQHSQEEYGSGSSSGLSGSKSGVNRIECLGEDILQLIFEHFDLQPGSQTMSQTRKGLLSAAKTCKAFAEPALNSLWRVLPSLLPLLLLLPSAEVVNGQYFVDNLPLTNWERFEIHARRVRMLYMEITRATVSHTTYLFIREMYGTPLLPGLKAIHIPNNNTIIDLPAVALLVSGVSLDSVELNNSAISERNFFLPFLTLLASKSPQLSHLSLHGLGNLSLNPLYRFKNIQRLEIRLSGTYLYPQAVRNLGRLVELQDLTLDAGAFTPTHAINSGRTTYSPPNSRDFGRLRRLHIIGIPSSITRVLDSINLTKLTALVIDEAPCTTQGHTKSFWIRLFDQVSVCLALEDIEINQHQYRSWGHEYYTHSTSWFHPLMDLKNVKSLVINGPALSGSDDDFRLMAVSFQKLKKLVVPPAYYSPGRTLACLLHFSQYCPDLREIEICFWFDITSNTDAIKNLQPSPTHQHLLEKLYVNSQFDRIETIHTIEIAQFLDALFPNLSILETYGSNTSNASIWKGIQQTRVALRAARIKALHQAKSEVARASTEI